MNGEKSSTKGRTNSWRDGIDLRADNEPEVCGIDKTKVLVSDLNRISSGVCTTEHGFKSEVLLESLDDVQTSNIGVLTVLEIWRNIITQSKKSHINREIFFGKVEWEVLLELELDLSLENR